MPTGGKVMKLLITAIAVCLATPAYASITPEQQNVLDGYELAMLAEQFCPDIERDEAGGTKYLVARMGFISQSDFSAAELKTINDLLPDVREMRRQNPAKFCEIAWKLYGPDGYKILQKK
jgi:hypothetical protein